MFTIVRSDCPFIYSTWIGQKNQSHETIGTFWFLQIFANMYVTVTNCHFKHIPCTILPIFAYLKYSGNSVSQTDTRGMNDHFLYTFQYTFRIYYLYIHFYIHFIFIRGMNDHFYIHSTDFRTVYTLVI